MPVYEIVASAENIRYMEWQAMLFHFSCVSVQGQVPIIAVHKGDEPLLPGFEMIAAHGGRIQPVANLRDLGDVCYPPRNTPVALRDVECDADFIVLCDADMVFMKPLPLAAMNVAKNAISFESARFLIPDADEFQPDLDDVFRNNGLDPQLLRHPVIEGGIPHVIPIELQQSLGSEWLRCIDLFPILYQGECPDVTNKKYADWPVRFYLACMWAILMAKHNLQLDHVMTSWCMTNQDDADPMPAPSESSPYMMHYAYGSEKFDKRAVAGDKGGTDAGFWKLPKDDGTVAGYLRRQFFEASRYYGLS